jgi:two-component system copper resistance phosphate regulon response regulator CusR
VDILSYGFSQGTSMAKLLLVEDDFSLAANIRRWLEFEHYMIEHVASGTEALSLMKSFTFDVIILDVNLPHMNGVEVCRQYRDSGGQSAVLMLTTRSEMIDKEMGFGAGADDYLSKPFNLKELSLRIKGLLKRSRAIQEGPLQCRDLVLDPTSRTVTVSGREIALQNLEYRILELLLRNRGQVLSSESILERTADSESERSTESLRTALKKLRKKIDTPDTPSIISNVHGVGYKISD